MKSYLLLLAISCILFNCASVAQQPDNKKAMYGAVEKDEQYKKTDQVFIQNALEQFSDRSSAVNEYLDLGWRYCYNNDLETAMKRFNQAWLLDSAFADAFFGFAVLMDLQGDGPAADRFYKMGHDKDPSGQRAAACYKRIADVKEQLKDEQGALAAYRKIVAIDSNNAFAYEKIGYFASGTGNDEEALLAYNKALALNPKSGTTYNNRAYLYQVQKKYAAAIADYSKAIELDPTYINAYVNRGVTAMEQKNYGAAKKDFEMAVRLAPGEGALWRLLGLAKQSLKDHTGACLDFNRAKELNDTLAAPLLESSCK